MRRRLRHSEMQRLNQSPMTSKKKVMQQRIKEMRQLEKSEQKPVLGYRKSILSGLYETRKLTAKLSAELKRLLRTGPAAVALLLSSSLLISCSSTGSISNVTFLEMSLEATEPTKPIPCETPQEPLPYPVPRGVILKAPIDRIDQGQAYGDAYKRGRDHFELREREQTLFWQACMKQYKADLEKYNSDVSARERAITRLREMEENN